jgi:hypothetical protein
VKERLSNVEQLLRQRQRIVQNRVEYFIGREVEGSGCDGCLGLIEGDIRSYRTGLRNLATYQMARWPNG